MGEDANDARLFVMHHLIHLQMSFPVNLGAER